MRSVLATVILSAATAASGFAHAEVAGNRVVVQRGDLDLDDPFDARTMVQRIDAAASRACGGNPRFYLDYRLHRPLLIEQYEACRDAAVSDALAQLNSPEVTRAYARFGEAGQG